MTKLTNILRSNWTLILGLGVLVGITMLNAGCDDWSLPGVGGASPGSSAFDCALAPMLPWC